MKFLFLTIETKKEFIDTFTFEYQFKNMNYKITKTIKLFNFVIYSNSKFTQI